MTSLLAINIQGVNNADLLLLLENEYDTARNCERK